MFTIIVIVRLLLVFGFLKVGSRIWLIIIGGRGRKFMCFVDYE